MSQDEVLIVGGGVMGCATAFALARRKIRVRVLERSVPGAEASSAAAGMLGAQVEAHDRGPFADLCLAGRERFADWSSALQEATGIDVEHRVCGITRAALSAAEVERIERHVAWQRDQGMRVELLTAAEARTVEPALAESVRMGARYADDARLDPPRYLRALRIAAERAGAVFQSGGVVRRVVVEGERARGVELEGGAMLEAGHVIVAAGSWSSLVPGVPLSADAVRPARGQIVELITASPVLRGVVYGESAYLSPRDDGRLLIGSTLEFVGFHRAVTAGAVRDLLVAAIDLIPALALAELSRTWAAFRPFTPDERPLIGRSAIVGLLLATGHYRNGILLSAITAEILTALIVGEKPPVDPAPFERRGASSP